MGRNSVFRGHEHIKIAITSIEAPYFNHEQAIRVSTFAQQIIQRLEIFSEIWSHCHNFLNNHRINRNPVSGRRPLSIVGRLLIFSNNFSSDAARQILPYYTNIIFRWGNETLCSLSDRIRTLVIMATYSIH